MNENEQVKKVVFFAMTKRGFYSLEKFIERFGPEAVEYVVSHPDKCLQKDYFDEINLLCRKSGIPVYDKDDNYSIEKPYIFVIGWRWVIKSSGKLFIFHDSLLPKYRGFAPMVTQLLNGEKSLGVTCFLSENQFDTGDIDKGGIAAQSSIDISYPIKIGDAIDKVCPLYSSLAIELYQKLAETGGNIPLKTQNDKDASYSVWRDEDDYKIDWTRDAVYIKRFIDSLGYPYKGAHSFIGGKKIIISDSEVYPDVKIETRDTGKVLFLKDNYPVVICGSGMLKILSAYQSGTGESILPLKKFRTRFL